MMSELEHLGGKRAESARLRRAEQLRRWKGSLTEQEPVAAGGGRGRHRGAGGSRVRFEEGAVFLAACSSGDTEEVKKLLGRGARINTTNVDGLTALHQACIDENLDMVKFLVENGANVNQQDNEGWTPLHAVASCGYQNIAEYLISHGANVAAVNSEGEVPSDIAEEAAMKDLLLEQVKKQGVDLELSRKEEEQQMLQDARQWLNSGRIEDIKQPRTGATALHVAAAKGYSEVMRLLIQAGFNLNVQDNDGWTPLHAAAHWGVKEACSILAEALCDMDIRNKLGQTPFDVADEGLVEHLEMLQKKQSVLRSEKETRNKLIEADMNGKPQNRLFTNKEKILYEEDTLKSMETEEENKDSSSSSSEEEEAEDEVSESDTEKESERKEEPFANHSSCESRPSITEQMPAPEPNSFTASARRFSWLSKADEQKDESPSSWRLGLRKTGSHNMLSEVSATREAQRDKTSPIYRSSSSPRISALLDNKEKDRDNKSYLATIVPRRLSSTSDTEEKENRESAVNLVRSGSYSQQPWRDEPKGNEAPRSGAPTTYVSTYLKRSYLTPVRDEEAESLRKARSRQARQTRRSTQGVTLTDLQEAERTFSRSRAEHQAQEPQGDRAEDSSDRPARWARSTDDETIYRRLRGPAQPDKPTTPVSPSTAAPLLYTSSYLTRTNKYLGLDSVNPADFRAAGTEMEKNECEDQDSDDRSLNKQSIRERRRPKERRRGTGIIFSTQDDEDEVGGNEEVKETRHERLSRLEAATNPSTSDSSFSERASGRSSAYSRRENRLAALSSRAEEESSRDYKKLYESALSENQKLKSKLQEAQLELADIKAKLEKAAQKQEKTSDRSSMLEMEKREKRALERKLSEMEEEMKNLHQLKQIHTLRQMNEQLLAENRALTRVVARLSLPSKPSESEEL
ncbi:protein phosphatase 1 regulatory subunit 12B isoform X6 [Haemorhous mexicanus]|uniref:protein phosphatase 1 regulatory subunit 12B isoform X6 n=1 Tax=Haemorhous mexicanus TaxID=30427 RepID=UPI0028BF2795|nr:protein phosphatase 1 regulatory subunit 12B isoform X6 [Haemorhous mexicanus]